MIFKNLDIVSATCLGLSSKDLYAVHIDLGGRGVKLHTWCVMPPRRDSGHRLYQVLLNWIPRSMTFSFNSFKFINREKRTWFDSRFPLEAHLMLTEARLEAEKVAGGYWVDATKWFPV
jgi:hypothetical protein